MKRFIFLCPPPLRRPSDQTQREELEEPHFVFQELMISCRVPVHGGSYCGGTKESDWLCVRGCVGVCALTV